MAHTATCAMCGTVVSSSVSLRVARDNLRQHERKRTSEGPVPLCVRLPQLPEGGHDQGLVGACCLLSPCARLS